MMAAIDAERSIMNDFFDGLRPWISSDGAIDRSYTMESFSEPLNQEKDAAVSDLVVVDDYNKADVDAHLERNTVDLDIFNFFYNSLYGRKDTVDYSEPAEIKDFEESGDNFMDCAIKEGNKRFII
ncbi:hypothetical protein NC651_016295 [Populus alba x Populus x berolinensis]|nr:hypothetical protein NC651_016295 [Populus alba x Populus x berolinensis]